MHEHCLCAGKDPSLVCAVPAEPSSEPSPASAELEAKRKQLEETAQKLEAFESMVGHPADGLRLVCCSEASPSAAGPVAQSTCMLLTPRVILAVAEHTCLGGDRSQAHKPQTLGGAFEGAELREPCKLQHWTHQRAGVRI